MLNNNVSESLKNDLSNQYASIWFLNHIVSIHHGRVSASRLGDYGIELSITLTKGTEFKSDSVATKFEHLKPVTLPKEKNMLRVSGDGKY